MTTTCAAVRNALVAYVADCLEPLEAGRVGDHLRACEECRARLGELSGMIGTMAGDEAPGLSPVRREIMRASLRVAATRAETVRYGALQVVGFAWAVLGVGTGAWGVFHADWFAGFGGPWLVVGATGLAAVISAGLVPVIRRARREGGG